MRKIQSATTLTMLCVLGIAGTIRADPFYMGGDISQLPFIESRGGRFSDGGVTMPAEQIMSNNGANLYRIRLFVNPGTDYYGNYVNPSVYPSGTPTFGATQNLTGQIALAQRLKQSGAKIMLDLHYSDYWADPGKQWKPYEWNNLSLPDLTTKMRDYTRDTLLAFKDAGVMPEMVQVGNEIRPGFLWNNPTTDFSTSGRLGNGINSTSTQWAQFGQLINAGIAGVRDAQSPGQHTDVIIHIDNAASFDGNAWFNKLKDPANGNVSDYDIIGLSYYPSTSANNTFDWLKTRLNTLIAEQTQDIMLVETNFRWRNGSQIGTWASSAAGQADFLKDLRDLGLSGNGLTDPARFIGVQWWFPEAVTVPLNNPHTGATTSIYNGGATAMWDDGVTAPDGLTRTHAANLVLDQLAIVSPTWNANSDGLWSDASKWTNGTPVTDKVARFGPNITAPRTVTLNAFQTTGSISFLSAHSYTIAAVGAGSLVLDAPNTGPAALNVLLGNHTISTPMAFADDTEINVGWTNTLTISGNLTATGKRITKYGSGTAQFENVRASGVDIQFGTVRISPKAIDNDSSGISEVDNLWISNLASLDLTNNAMNIFAPGEPIDSVLNEVREHLRSGRIRSSLAAADHRLGFASMEVLGSEIVAIRYVYSGDANLDGQVDARDLYLLALGWLGSGLWTDGDFNYDGFVDQQDLTLLAQNWQAGNGAPLGSALQELGLPNVVVPEPGCLSLFAAGMWLTGRSRRRFTC